MTGDHTRVEVQERRGLRQERKEPWKLEKGAHLFGFRQIQTLPEWEYGMWLLPHKGRLEAGGKWVLRDPVGNEGKLNLLIQIIWLCVTLCYCGWAKPNLHAALWPPLSWVCSLGWIEQWWLQKWNWVRCPRKKEKTEASCPSLWKDACSMDNLRILGLVLMGVKCQAAYLWGNICWDCPNEARKRSHDEERFPPACARSGCFGEWPLGLA